ncbi:DUF3301 domain-containing protein [Pseudomonadota bacterium]
MAGLSLFDILAVTLIAGGVWYFFDAMRARESATAAVREYCNHSSLQFLDGTVGLKTVSLCTESGKPCLRRRYEFHFSESDHSRSIGLVTMKGAHVENFILPATLFHPKYSTIEA